MRDHKALFNTATHMVQLDSLVHGIMVLQLSSPPVIVSSLNHLTALSLEDILVAREFPDVFPNDLHAYRRLRCGVC
jgi:hypothetical protein